MGKDKFISNPIIGILKSYQVKPAVDAMFLKIDKKIE